MKVIQLNNLNNEFKKEIYDNSNIIVEGIYEEWNEIHNYIGKFNNFLHYFMYNNLFHISGNIRTQHFINILNSINAILHKEKICNELYQLKVSYLEYQIIYACCTYGRKE